MTLRRQANACMPHAVHVLYTPLTPVTHDKTHSEALKRPRFTMKLFLATYVMYLRGGTPNLPLLESTRVSNPRPQK